MQKKEGAITLRSSVRTWSSSKDFNNRKPVTTMTRGKKATSSKLNTKKYFPVRVSCLVWIANCRKNKTLKRRGATKASICIWKDTALSKVLSRSMGIGMRNSRVSFRESIPVVSKLELNCKIHQVQKLLIIKVNRNPSDRLIWARLRKLIHKERFCSKKWGSSAKVSIRLKSPKMTKYV